MKELSKIIGYGYVKGRNKTRMGNPDENCMTDYSQSEKKMTKRDNYTQGYTLDKLIPNRFLIDNSDSAE